VINVKDMGAVGVRFQVARASCPCLRPPGTGKMPVLRKKRVKGLLLEVLLGNESYRRSEGYADSIV